MIRGDLIDRLQSELDELQHDKIEDYEKSFIWIREQVDKLADNAIYNQLVNCFEDFISWPEVKEKLLCAVYERDSRELGFLTKQVDLDSEYYYIDANGFLCNIDEDAVYTLLDSLLYLLKR